MLDLGEPLVSFDTCFMRARSAEVFAALCDPFAWAAFWPGVRTFDHKMSGPPDSTEALAGLCDPLWWVSYWRSGTLGDAGGALGSGGLANISVGDRWRLRALMGRSGMDGEVLVTDMRFRSDGAGGNVWMDWVGELEPCVGLPLQRRPFDAETEWWVRPWHEAALVSFVWRIRSLPERRQTRFMLDLRRLGWRAMSTLKRELEGEP